MKLAVSIALIVLLLGMPVGCILVGFNPAHPCCPRTNTNVRCPYVLLDNAKIVGIAAIAVVLNAAVTGVTPPADPVFLDLLPEIAEDQPDLYILNRILRV